MITNYDVVIGLYFNILIQIAGNTGGRVNLVFFILVLYFFLAIQAW